MGGLRLADMSGMVVGTFQVFVDLRTAPAAHQPLQREYEYTKQLTNKIKTTIKQENIYLIRL